MKQIDLTCDEWLLILKTFILGKPVRGSKKLCKKLIKQVEEIKKEINNDNSNRKP